jgi:hypothetical protein
VVRPATEGDIRISGPAYPNYPSRLRLYPVCISGSHRRGGYSRRVDRFGTRERSQYGPTQDRDPTQVEHPYDHSTANAYPAVRLGDCRFSADARSGPGYRKRSGASAGHVQRLWLWR